MAAGCFCSAAFLSHFIASLGSLGVPSPARKCLASKNWESASPFCALKLISENNGDAEEPSAFANDGEGSDSRVAESKMLSPTDELPMIFIV